MNHLCEDLDLLDRPAGLKGYCTGPMQPLARKLVEPVAARIDYLHVSDRHQALHHFVGKAQWSDSEMLRRSCQCVVSERRASRGVCQSCVTTMFWLVESLLITGTAASLYFTGSVPPVTKQICTSTTMSALSASA